MNRGIVFAGSAYVLWGVFPLYFHLLRGIPAFEVLMQRIVWSLVVLVAILVVRRRWAWLRDTARNPAIVGRYALSAVLIGVNWYVYIWAVQNGHVLDASLGYFITPLFSVLLGRVVLGERPRAVQWAAIAIAACGVLWLGVRAGHVPWVGLVLASSFSGYGLVKKMTPLGALEGLALETALLFPVAVASLLVLASHGQNALVTGDPALRWFLVAAGPLTALPMLLFGAGARRIPLTTLGLLQYISPTIQLLVGVLILGEVFSASSLFGYLMIWSALGIYAVDGLVRTRRTKEPVAP